MNPKSFRFSGSYLRQFYFFRQRLRRYQRLVQVCAGAQSEDKNIHSRRGRGYNLWRPSPPDSARLDILSANVGPSGRTTHRQPRILSMHACRCSDGEGRHFTMSPGVRDIIDSNKVEPAPARFNPTPDFPEKQRPHEVSHHAACKLTNQLPNKEYHFET